MISKEYIFTFTALVLAIALQALCLQSQVLHYFHPLAIAVVLCWRYWYLKYEWQTWFGVTVLVVVIELLFGWLAGGLLFALVFAYLIESLSQKYIKTRFFLEFLSTLGFLNVFYLSFLLQNSKFEISRFLPFLIVNLLVASLISQLISTNRAKHVRYR